MPEILDALKNEAEKADSETDHLKHDPSVSTRRLSEAEGYARGLWRAYYIVNDLLNSAEKQE